MSKKKINYITRENIITKAENSVFHFSSFYIFVSHSKWGRIFRWGDGIIPICNENCQVHAHPRPSVKSTAGGTPFEWWVPIASRNPK